jgi:DNA repair exonuclease SbcCD nuclease subunit
MAANRDTSRPLVIMGHLSVVGALTSSGQPLVGREIQIVAEDLAETGAAYVALGHIHKAQEIAPRVVYAGSLTIRDFGEEGEEKCVVLVGLAGEDLVESIPIKCRDWVTIDAGPSPEGLPPWEAVRGLLPEPEIIDALVPGANVRYRYACDEASVSRFDHAEIARRFADAHTLKIVPQITRSARVRAADVAAARSLADKLRAWGQVTGTEIYDRLLDRLDQLEEEVSHGS